MKYLKKEISDINKVDILVEEKGKTYHIRTSKMAEKLGASMGKNMMVLDVSLKDANLVSYASHPIKMIQETPDIAVTMTINGHNNELDRIEKMNPKKVTKDDLKKLTK